MAHDEPNKVCRVAVIGAGAAGLVAARELNREGHQVVVFELADHVGGTWVYDPQVETDPLGLDPARTVVHSSMYLSLRTNLPREVMGFRDYPFKVVEGRDCRRLPGHKEVALYLQDFAAEFGLLNFIRFRTTVEYVGRDPNNQNKWIVRSNAEKRDVIEELYDAVVVCSGHHTQPRVAEIPGIDKWPGKQIHSHNYRVPAPFQDQCKMHVKELHRSNSSLPYSIARCLILRSASRSIVTHLRKAACTRNSAILHHNKDYGQIFI